MDRSETYLRFCTAHDPAGRIAAHVELALECRLRECARVAEEEWRAAVDRMAA